MPWNSCEYIGCNLCVKLELRLSDPSPSHGVIIKPQPSTKLAKAEKASGGSGWESQRWYQDLLERASVSIARSNYEMLRNNRSLPRA